MNPNNKSPLGYAFYLLAKRDYGIEELRGKVYNKYERAETDEVIDKLIAKKFLDDEWFAKNYIKLKKNFKGKHYLQAKLKFLKISGELIDQALEQEYSVDEEYSSVKELALKYLRKKEGEENLYQKMGSFLLRKGFSYETVKKVINEVIK
jgi:regulatory protein